MYGNDLGKLVPGDGHKVYFHIFIVPQILLSLATLDMANTQQKLNISRYS